MSSSNLYSNEENQDNGKGSAWSSFSSRFQDLRQKAMSKGSELAGYANQQIMSRIKKEEPAQREVKERHVFGIPLEYVMASSGHEYGIPLIVYQCVNEITEAIEEEGLYRIPGSNHQVEVLKDKFDFLEPVDLTGENPNTVATLLKLFLRQLPNKLIDDSHTNKLNDIIRKYNVQGPEDFIAFDEFAEILEELPGWEYNLLRYICFHLKSVSDNAEFNKMTINNLSLIFCPTLKIPPIIFSILVIHSQNVFRRFLSDEDDYEGEYDDTNNNENYDESEDNTHTNEQDFDNSTNHKNNNNEESNFADFDNNQEVLKLNSNFNTKVQNSKEEENASDTLINSEDDNKVS